MVLNRLTGMVRKEESTNYYQSDPLRTMFTKVFLRQGCLNSGLCG